MKQKIGIWIDTRHAVIVKLSNETHSVKIIESNIDTRERVAGETKKYGRFGGQYLTYEKNRLHRKHEQTNQYFKELSKEIQNSDSVVLFGPGKMKNLFEKEMKSNMQMASKLSGAYNSDSLTENQTIAWVKDFYNK